MRYVGQIKKNQIGNDDDCEGREPNQCDDLIRAQELWAAPQFFGTLSRAYWIVERPGRISRPIRPSETNAAITNATVGVTKWLRTAKAIKGAKARSIEFPPCFDEVVGKGGQHRWHLGADRLSQLSLWRYHTFAGGLAVTGYQPPSDIKHLPRMGSAPAYRGIEKRARRPQTGGFLIAGPINRNSLQNINSRLTN